MSFLAKIGVFLLILAVLGFAIWLSAHEAYGNGFAAAQLADQKAIGQEQAKSRALAAQLLAKNTQNIPPIQAAAETAQKAADNALPAQVQTIVKVIHEAPTYAACTRPAAVEQLRDTDLSSLTTLAGQSALAASSSAPSVPGAGPGP